MKKAWYKIPSKTRRAIAYFLIGLGLTVLLAFTVSGILNVLDRAGLAIIEQLDSQSQWAVQESLK